MAGAPITPPHLHVESRVGFSEGKWQGWDSDCQARALSQQHRGIWDSRLQTEPAGPGSKEVRPREGGPFHFPDPRGAPSLTPGALAKCRKDLDLRRSLGKLAFLISTRELQHPPLKDVSVSVQMYSYFKRNDISTERPKRLPLLSHCRVRCPTPSAWFKATSQLSARGQFVPRPSCKTLLEKGKHRRHLECPQRQPGMFPSKASGFPFITISLLMQNQDTTAFCREETLTPRPSESQDYGMVVWEGTPPLTAQSRTPRLREAKDWPKVTQPVVAEPARKPGLLTSAGPPLCSSLSKASASSPLG